MRDEGADGMTPHIADEARAPSSSSAGCDLPELGGLNELARGARLISREDRRVFASSLGRRAAGDPNLLWRIVVADLFSAGPYEGEGAALAAAMLLRAIAPVPATGETMARLSLPVPDAQAKTPRRFPF